MTTTPAVPALYGKATVGLPADKAFNFFADSFGRWWPADYHIGQADMADAILEAGVGGRWYERGVDGSECDWGRVLVWEPPHLDRLVAGQAIRTMIGQGGGWVAILELFGKAAEAQ